MYDEIKYKDKIYQTKSLDSAAELYEIVDNKLFKLSATYKINAIIPYDVKYHGILYLYDINAENVCLKFTDGLLVEEKTEPFDLNNY